MTRRDERCDAAVCLKGVLRNNKMWSAVVGKGSGILNIKAGVVQVFRRRKFHFEITMKYYATGSAAKS